MPKGVELKERRKQIKKLDKLWSLKIRSKGACEICSKGEGLAAHHIHPRTKYNTRFDLENGICLCYRHHIHFAHKDVIEFSEFIKERLGQKKYDDLRIRANMSGKGQDLTAIEMDLNGNN